MLSQRPAPLPHDRAPVGERWPKSIPRKVVREVSSERQTEPPRVLLVEDDEDNRELLAELLSTAYTVETAASGTEGLELFERLRPAIVITDQTLPGLRGSELARAIKERAPSTHVLLISGHHHLADAEACDRVLSKPLDVDRFLTTVAELAADAGSNSA